LKYDSEDYWASLIKMSLSRFFILYVLHKHSLHGYEIAKQVADITGGCCAPTEGSLYPVLREFVDNGLVDVETQIVSGRERKVYTITSQGERAYEIAKQAWGEVARHILQTIGDE